MHTRGRLAHDAPAFVAGSVLDNGNACSVTLQEGLHTLCQSSRRHAGDKAMSLSGSVLVLVLYLILTMHIKTVALSNRCNQSVPSPPLETNSFCSETRVPSFSTVRKEKRASPYLCEHSPSEVVADGRGEATFTLP